MISKSSGFSLVELLVVIAIIGILSAAGTLTYTGYVKGAKRNSAENLIQQVSLAQSEEYANTGDYFITGGANACEASKASSDAIQDGLFDGEPIMDRDASGNPDNDFEICVFGSGSSYTVFAKEMTTGSTCVISVGKYGTPQRSSGC